MLELLGKPAIVGSGWAEVSHHLPDGHDGVASIAPRGPISHLCPVVRVLGRLRLVLPNGDLEETQPDEVEPVPAQWLGERD